MPSRTRSKAVNAREAATTQVSELSLHLLRAQEEERKRISRELHDETGQGLMVLRLYLSMVANECRGGEAEPKIQDAMTMLDRTIGDLRRIIARLSPRTLDELGLLAAIRKEARELTKNTGIKGKLFLPENLNGVDHEFEVGIYRAVQEALHNVAKHSQAQNCVVRLELEQGELRLLIEDDGVGFSRTDSRRGSFGLWGMRERIAALGGTVRVRSRNGRGTRVRVMLPAFRKTRKLSTVPEVGEEIHPNRVGGKTKKGRKRAQQTRLLKPETQYIHAHPMHSS
ncbi:MAG TPA: sensor histidine kinase [Terriglobales bacterium]|nr:sensor histidine kinase [Terriglobales bacterium]